MSTGREIKNRRAALIEEAVNIGRWAESKKLLRLGQPVVEFERRKEFPMMFSARESALLQKPITAIGINPRRNAEKGGTIFIYTQSTLTRSDQTALTDAYQGTGQLEFKVLKPFRSKLGVSPVTPPRRIGGYIPCGSSISLAVMRDAGTLGALVKIGDQLYGLSANHVTGGCSNAPLRSPILFPGILDVGPDIEDPLTIGHHYRGLPMIPGAPQNFPSDGSFQNLDAAIFSIRDRDTVTSFQCDAYDTPAQVETDLDVLEDLEVEKVGRTTGHTMGWIESSTTGFQPLNYKLTVFVNASEQIPFEGMVYYQSAYIMRGDDGLFAREGDSGAIVVSRPNGANSSRKAVGLLIGGEGEIAIMLPLAPILEAFQASLVSNYNVPTR